MQIQQRDLRRIDEGEPAVDVHSDCCIEAEPVPPGEEPGCTSVRSQSGGTGDSASAAPSIPRPRSSVQERALAAQKSAAPVGDAEPATAGDVEAQIPGCHHLPDQRAPFVLAPVGAHAEGRQAVVAEAPDLLRPAPAQDVDDMRREWASSMANSVTGNRFSAASMGSVISRSGAM